MADFDALIKAFRRASRVAEDAERVAQAQVRAKRQRREAAREALAMGIVDAWQNGTLSQSEMARRTGYSREQIRRILRTHGVEPGE